jgi:hypothetical protein
MAEGVRKHHTILQKGFSYMEEFERIYGMFGDWRTDFLPGRWGEGPVTLVPMKAVVERYVNEKHQQKYKEKLLARWTEERKADGVTDMNTQLDKAAWEG